MGVTTDDHAFTASYGNAGMEAPASDMSRGLAVFLKEGLYILDPMLEQEVLIFVFDEKKDLAPFDHRERRGN